ncbi:uncharacterized protein Dana_GF15833, isoform B [Drosophila ananassae]|uniref:Uncharacterized protein, isoform B n=1 Tax=Drosophila ananassae TaxID=7217 RepID=A0A0P8XGL2_DROAN|nr:uncharacterized protein LOC6498638 isoform X2 [Drosophila ananassae]KPU73939.1 uncharacterized protein Dana_GF15833, isoform B [Drosophila ananassae]
MSFEHPVEFNHDENILFDHRHSYLSEFLTKLTLKSSEDQSEESSILNEKLLQFKFETELLDLSYPSPDYYAQKEELIYKVVCEIKGLKPQNEQEFMETSPVENFLDTYAGDVEACVIVELK